jgi:integrase
VLSAPAGHPLLGRPVCRVPGCGTTAPRNTRICASCQRRLAADGIDTATSAELPPRPDQARGPGGCAVSGCGRERLSGPAQLCRPHHDQRERFGASIEAFTAAPEARPLPPLKACTVPACPRQRRHPGSRYCDSHQQRLRGACKSDPALDEERWRQDATAIGTGGQVSFRGLPPLAIAEILAGLQQRCRTDGVKTREAELRAFCDDLRRQRAASLSGYVLDPGRSMEFKGMVNSLAAHARRALATPETEVAGDVWDLTLFGRRGTVDFTVISQRWLRETARRWAADDLPRRKINPGRITGGGGAVRHHVRCLARLSESLRMRPDRGENPAALGRADMEAFLGLLAFLASAGTISADARIRACREVRHVISCARMMGLTRPAGLGEDFTVQPGDVPVKPGERGRDLPPEIMRQLCDHLDLIASPEIRTATELAIDTGRRPEEIAALDWDCLARDADGAPVLVYENHKASRARRCLPVSEATAAVITAQQRVRERFPATPVAELKLLPTDRRNPHGRKAITAFTFGFAHRSWIGRLPVLRTGDGTEFSRKRVFPYACRHIYVICTPFSA